MKELYIFLAYKSEKDYPLKPFHTKLFEDHTKMKVYSSKHSYKYKHKHAEAYHEYVSTYTKIKI